MKAFTLTLLLAVAPVAQAAEVTAALYEIGSPRERPLFTYRRTIQETPTGPLSSSIFTNSEGHEAAFEELSISPSGKPLKYFVRFPEVGEEGGFEVRGDRIFFSYKRGSRILNGEEPLTPDFVAGPMVFSFLQTHWYELSEGRWVNTRLAVPDRAETVGFSFYKVSEFQRDGLPMVKIKARPSNFLIAALVTPLILTCESATGRVVEMSGTTLLRFRQGGGVGNLSADMVFR